MLPWNLSDHIPEYIIIKKAKNTFIKAEFTRCSYRNCNDDYFIEMINQRNWEEFYKTNKVNTQWEQLYNSVLEILNQLIPVKKCIFPISPSHQIAVCGSSGIYTGFKSR